MKPWFASVAVAAVIAGAVPSLAQTGTGAGRDATAVSPSGTTAAPAANSMHQKKTGVARHARTSGASTAPKGSSDDQTTAQLNREELQRLQQPNR